LLDLVEEPFDEISPPPIEIHKLAAKTNGISPVRQRHEPTNSARKSHPLRVPNFKPDQLFSAQTIVERVAQTDAEGYLAGRAALCDERARCCITQEPFILDIHARTPILVPLILDLPTNAYRL